MTYLHGDHLGSTSKTTGAASSAQLYEAYGAKRGSSEVDTLYRYTGQRWEENDALDIYYYKARWYDPQLGRFLQPDPFVPEATNPQNLNRYSYALGNPLKYLDPTGYWTQEELDFALGKDWQSVYFGEGAVFEGRDKLRAFLESDETGHLVGLGDVANMMRGAADLHNLGVDFRGVDAIGERISLSGGVVFAGAEAGIDVVLNLVEGEMSYFASVGGGVLLGGGVWLSGGNTVMFALPSNDAYRGYADSIGLSAAEGLGVAGEYFKSLPSMTDPIMIADPLRAFEGARGAYFGAGLGAGVGGYDFSTVSYEIYRLNVDGGKWQNFWQQVAALRASNQ